jgi:hypothetical protein
VQSSTALRDYFVSFNVGLYYLGIARSDQINAYKGVKLKKGALHIVLRLYHQTIFGRAGFAIISITGASRTYRSHTASFTYMLTGLI